MVRAVVGLMLGFIGFISVLTASWQVAYVNFIFLSGARVVFVVSLAVGDLLLWFAGKLLNNLTRSAPTA
jgi:hypothetical protein